MLVPVMQIGIVRMAMHERRVGMPMRMRLARGRVGVVVLVMFVMKVAMLVLDRLVRMIMLVPLGEMQPKSERHQTAGDQQLQR